jgi:hypothetical protein
MWMRLLVVASLLGATGWFHGQWTDRWGASGNADGAARLPSVPLTMGDWEGRDITREESEVAARSTSPQIVRRYVHRRTGAAVGLLITCGRPSSMIIEHTPKTCYAQLGFEESGAECDVLVGPPEALSTFHAHTFVKPTPVKTDRVRLLWSWGDGRNWSFPDRPRVAFSRAPVLYKIYATRDLLAEDEPLTDDPVVSFLESTLPEITAALSDGNR